MNVFLVHHTVYFCFKILSTYFTKIPFSWVDANEMQFSCLLRFKTFSTNRTYDFLHGCRFTSVSKRKGSQDDWVPAFKYLCVSYARVGHVWMYSAPSVPGGSSAWPTCYRLVISHGFVAKRNVVHTSLCCCASSKSFEDNVYHPLWGQNVSTHYAGGGIGIEKTAFRNDDLDWNKATLFHGKNNVNYLSQDTW